MEFLKNVNIDKIRNAAEDVINQAKPKTDVEARVYEVLSHKNWGSSSTLMNEIARDTFDYERYNVVIKILWESIENQRPAAWRVVFKGLTLLEHLVKNGSERCVDDGRNHSHILRSLNNFNYYEGTVDRGVGVREKSKQIVELLADNERIREERTKAKQLRDKFGNIGGGISSSGGSGGGTYAGYGKNDFDDGGSRYNGGSGYGNSGIGSGGYSDSGIGSDGGRGNSNSGDFENYSGRYSDSNATSNGTDAAPTFAALPPEKKEKKKSKKAKKKKEKSSPEKIVKSPPADLLAFDDPAPAADDDGFDAFKGSATSDSFDAFQEPTATASTSNTTPVDSFDAFGTSESKQATFETYASPPSTQESQPTFDAFSAPTSSASVMTGNTNMNTVNDMFGNMNVGVQGQSNMTSFQPSFGVSGGNIAPTGHQVNNDDDFGDFADADKEKSTNSDPLNNLISLDGLSKNKKQDDIMGQPIAFNDAAKAQISTSTGSRMNSSMSQNIAFEGVDGLSKPPMMNSPPGTAKSTNVPIMGDGNNTNLDFFAKNQQSQMPMAGNMAQGMGNMMNGMNGNSSNMMNGVNMGGMSMATSNINMMNGGSGNMGGMNMGGGNQQQSMSGNMMSGGGMGMQQQSMPGNNMGGYSSNMMSNGGMGMGGQSLNGSNSNMMGGEQMGGWK